MGKRISLQRSITWSVLLIGLLSGTLALAYAYWHAKQSFRTTIGLNFQALAHHSADKISLMLAREVEWVERLSALPETRTAVKSGLRLSLDRSRLQQWQEVQGQYFRSLVIIDREGHLIGGSTSDVTRAYYARQPWWEVTLNQGRAWAGDLHVDDAGRGAWEVAVPISDEGGKILGALKVVIDVDEIFAPILRTRIGQTGHVMFLADSGRVLLCPVLPPGLHARTEALASGHRQAGLSWVGPAWMEVHDDSHGGRGGLVGVAPVVLPARVAQAKVWHILVRQDPKETYAPVLALMWKVAAFWLGTIGLLALFGSRLAQQIVRPLNAIVEKVQRLGDGQSATESCTTESGGIVEVEALEIGVNRLAERLETASRETQRYVQELERANREIRNSEQHYRRLWNHAADSKLILNARGSVQDVNRRAELKLGRRAEDLVGLEGENLFLNQDRMRFRTLLRQVLETDKEGAAREMHVETGTGAVLTMDLDIVPIESAGSVTAVLLQMSDVTEKKQLEQQLLRSERLASLSQFASMFAHDIRNPLAGIKKTLELLGQRPELQADPIGRWFSDLQLTTDLLLGMINDMLDVYQESYSGLPLVSSRFSVGLLFQEVAHLFRSEAEARGVAVCLDLPEDDVVITGDRRRLLRVGINLVHNALKYSPPDGRITVSIRVGRVATLSPDLDLPGDLVVALIRVEDEGPGIDPEDLPCIFEMFFRKKDGRDLRIGRGLGLHFCQLVVEAHRGRIWAANRPTGGAQFSIMLPLKAGEACRSGS